MPIILLTSLVGYVLAFERLMVWGYWRTVDRPFYGALDSAGLRGLLRICAPKPRLTPIAQLLVRAAELPAAAPEQLERAMRVEILARLPRVNTRISTIGWLGSILPMLGLLGTVSGMIVTFKDLALTSSRQVLSQGLSEALWTTEVGLLAALPLLASHHLLSRLRSRWMDQLELGLSLLFQSQQASPGGKAASPGGKIASPGGKNEPRGRGGSARGRARRAGHEA